MASAKIWLASICQSFIWFHISVVFKIAYNAGQTKKKGVYMDVYYNWRWAKNGVTPHSIDSQEQRQKVANGG